MILSQLWCELATAGMGLALGTRDLARAEVFFLPPDLRNPLCQSQLCITTVCPMPEARPGESSDI